MGYRNKSVADEYLKANPGLPPSYIPPPSDMPLPPLAGPVNLNVPSPLSSMPGPAMPAIAPDNGALVPNSVMAPAPMPNPIPTGPGQGGSGGGSGGASQLQRLQVEQPSPINAMPMGPQFIPTMEQTTVNQNQTTTQGLDKASQQRYQAAQELGKEAIAEREKFDVKKSQAEALSKEEMASIVGEQADEKEALREQQKQAQIQAEQDLKKSADEAMKYEFDQGRVWKRMGTAGSITAGIGIALGALAQGFGAKSNAALDVMDKQITRDIEQQRMEYEKIKDKTRAQESAYGRLRQMGLDDTQAQDTIHKQAIEQARLGIEAGFLKTMGPEEAFAKSKEAVAKLEADNAKAMETKFNKTMGSTTTTQKGMKAVGVGSLDPKARIEIQQSADKDEVIKPYRNAKTALGEFNTNIDPKTGIANPVAVASFVSGTTGMNQGSYDPRTFNSAMSSLGFARDVVNKIRESFLGNKPLDPTITKNIQQLLNSRIKNTEPAAKRRFATTYKNLGLDEQDVLGGNVTLGGGGAPRENF